MKSDDPSQYVDLASQRYDNGRNEPEWSHDGYETFSKLPPKQFQPYVALVEASGAAPPARRLRRTTRRHAVAVLAAASAAVAAASAAVAPATGASAHCLLYTSPSPRDRQKSRMPSSA